MRAFWNGTKKAICAATLSSTDDAFTDYRPRLADKQEKNYLHKLQARMSKTEADAMKEIVFTMDQS